MQSQPGRGDKPGDWAGGVRGSPPKDSNARMCPSGQALNFPPLPVGKQQLQIQPPKYSPQNTAETPQNRHWGESPRDQTSRGHLRPGPVRADHMPRDVQDRRRQVVSAPVSSHGLAEPVMPAEPCHRCVAGLRGSGSQNFQGLLPTHAGTGHRRHVGEHEPLDHGLASFNEEHRNLLTRQGLHLRDLG